MFDDVVVHVVVVNVVVVHVVVVNVVVVHIIVVNVVVHVQELPPFLIVHLKRFEFDFETMTRRKLNDKFEFPLHLNLYVLYCCCRSSYCCWSCCCC